MATATEQDDDQVIQQIERLSEDTAEAHKLFQKKAAILSSDPAKLATELSELFGYLVDLAQLSARAHRDTYDWGGEIQSALEDLEEGAPGGDASSLLEEDALKLKALLLDAQQNLRASTGADDDIPQILKTRIDEAVKAIDEWSTPADDDEDPEE